MSHVLIRELVRINRLLHTIAKVTPGANKTTVLEAAAEEQAKDPNATTLSVLEKWVNEGIRGATQ